MEADIDFAREWTVGDGAACFRSPRIHMSVLQYIHRHKHPLASYALLAHLAVKDRQKPSPLNSRAPPHRRPNLGHSPRTRWTARTPV